MGASGRSLNLREVSVLGEVGTVRNMGVIYNASSSKTPCDEGRFLKSYRDFLIMTLEHTLIKGFWKSCSTKPSAPRGLHTRCEEDEASHEASAPYVGEVYGGP